MIFNIMCVETWKNYKQIKNTLGGESANNLEARAFTDRFNQDIRFFERAVLFGSV
jgi:hypothetical protein